MVYLKLSNFKKQKVEWQLSGTEGRKNEKLFFSEYKVSVMQLSSRDLLYRAILNNTYEQYYIITMLYCFILNNTIVVINTKL